MSMLVTNSALKLFFVVSLGARLGARAPRLMNAPAGDPRSKRVVVVDDDDDVRELHAAVLEREGFAVQAWPDGLEAVRAVEGDPPDLILLDLMMPRFAGFEVVRRLQQGPAASVPIIVMTGRYKDKATADMVRSEANVVEYLEKPVSPEALAKLIHRVLNTRAPKHD